MMLSGGLVYIGGGFNIIGGSTMRSGAAAIDVAGDPTAWNPHPDRGFLALAMSGATVYGGGAFTTISGQTRNGLAAETDESFRRMPSSGNLSRFVISSATRIR